MPQTTEEMITSLNKAMKGIIDVNTLGDSVLAPAKFDQFIRQMQERTKILEEARFIPMDAQQVDIDRIAFMGRVLRSGKNADGSVKTLSENEYAEASTFTNKLVAQELQAITGLNDRALRRSIERGNFEDTLIELFGQAAGRDMEEWAIFADGALSFAEEGLMSVTDGWVKKAANVIYNDDFGTEKPVTTMFKKMINALPKQYLQDAGEWRLYVDWETYDGYREEQIARQTGLGDAALVGTGQLMYKGIPVEHAPMLDRHRAENAADETSGSVAMLQHPDNMAWGVFHEVTIERDRVAKQRRTDFVLTFEGDAHYEDENAAVIAMIDKAAPTAE